MDFIDYLESHYAVDWVSGGKQIKLSGECPFCHEDRHDLRLYIDPETLGGMCHHCGQGFGPVGFVAAAERCNFEKAKEILATDEDAFIIEREKIATPAMTFPIMVPVEACPAAQDYLKDRDIGHDVIDYFRLFYAPHNTKIGEKLFRTSSRVVIPIHDIEGRPIAWQARDITGKSKLKYLFPPGFKAADHLYHGWGIAKNPEYLIIAEGTFDAYGWWRAGIKNVVATFGKKISEVQAEIVRRINPKAVFIAWDSDAHLRKYEFAERYGHMFKIRITNLMGKDADELNRSELIEALGKSKGFNWSDKILGALV